MSTPPRQDGQSSHPPKTPGWIFGLFSARKPSARVDSSTESTLESSRDGATHYHPLVGRPPRTHTTHVDLLSPSYNPLTDGPGAATSAADASPAEINGTRRTSGTETLTPLGSIPFGSPTLLHGSQASRGSAPLTALAASTEESPSWNASSSSKDAGFAVSLYPSSRGRNGSNSGRSRFQSHFSSIRLPLRPEPLNLQEKLTTKRYRPAGFLQVNRRHRSSKVSDVSHQSLVNAMENYTSRHTGTKRNTDEVNYPIFKPGWERTRRSRLPFATEDQEEANGDHQETAIITVTEPSTKRRRVEFNDSIATTPAIKAVGEYNQRRKDTPYKVAPTSPGDGGNDDDGIGGGDDDDIRTQGSVYSYDRDLPEMPESIDMVDAGLTDWSNLRGREVFGPPAASSITLEENFILSLPTPEPNHGRTTGKRFEESKIIRPIPVILPDGQPDGEEDPSSKKARDDHELPGEEFGWGDLFKDQADKIKCPDCLTMNPKGSRQCLSCGYEFATDSGEGASSSNIDGGEGASSSNTAPPTQGTIGATGFNFLGPSPGSATSTNIGPTGFTFGGASAGSSGTGGFSFGSGTASTPDQPVPTQPSQPVPSAGLQPTASSSIGSTGFTFTGASGSSVTGGFSFGSGTTSAPPPTTPAPVLVTAPVFSAPSSTSRTSSGFVFGAGTATQQEKVNDEGTLKSPGTVVGAASSSSQTQPTGGLFGSNIFGQGRTSSSTEPIDSKAPAAEPSFKRSRGGDDGNKGKRSRGGDDVDIGSGNGGGGSSTLPSTILPFPSLVPASNAGKPVFSFASAKGSTDVPVTESTAELSFPSAKKGSTAESTLESPTSSTEAQTHTTSTLPLFGSSGTATSASSQVSSDTATPAPVPFTFGATRSAESSVLFGQAQSSSGAPVSNFFGTSGKPANTPSTTSGNSSLPSSNPPRPTFGSSATPGPFGNSSVSGSSFAAAPSSVAPPAPFGSIPSQAPAFGSVSGPSAIFGSSPAPTAAGSFGSAATAPAFGSTPAAAPFGSTPAQEVPAFGSAAATPGFGSAPAPAPFVFGSGSAAAPAPFGSATAAGAPFASMPYPSAPTFGSSVSPTQQTVAFGSQPGQFGGAGGFGQQPAAAQGQLSGFGGGNPVAPTGVEGGFNLGTGGTPRRTPGTGTRRVIRAKRPNR